jgi:hypothetical protein
MSYGIAFAALVLFVVAFRYSGIILVARDALRRTQSSVALILNQNVSEEEKERASREGAITLFGRFFAITGLTLIALVPSCVIVALALWAGIADQDSLFAAMASPWLIAAAVAVILLDYAIHR